MSAPRWTSAFVAFAAAIGAACGLSDQGTSDAPPPDAASDTTATTDASADPIDTIDASDVPDATVLDASAPDTGAPCGRLLPNESLKPAQPLPSCSGRYNLILGLDGDLVLYDGAMPIWTSWYDKRGMKMTLGVLATMQPDGNFVVYGATPAQHYFDTGTSGHPGSYLSVQNDGNLVVYEGSMPRWASNTAGK